MKVYLVRHGRSTGNLPGRMTGWSDHSLTDVGVEQATRVAARLAPLGAMPILSSDLPRALETARLIARRWPEGERLITADERLREIGLGEYEGRSWDEFTRDAALAARFDADPFTTALPGGESLGMVSERAVAAFDDALAAAGASPSQAAVVVAHDSPIRAIVNHALLVPPERHWTLTTSHGGLSLLEMSDGWVSVHFVNDTSHLRGLDRSREAEAVDEAPTRAIERASEGEAGD